MESDTCSGTLLDSWYSRYIIKISALLFVQFESLSMLASKLNLSSGYAIETTINDFLDMFCRSFFVLYFLFIQNLMVT